MRTTMLFMCVFCGLWTSAQTRYPFPSKTENFSEWDWLEVLSDIANDSAILKGMKNYHGVPIALKHKPYVCYLGAERVIHLQFCPDCIWIVDSCTDRNHIKYVSIAESSGFNFSLTDIPTEESWLPGDMVNYLFFLLSKSVPDYGLCYLTPTASRQWMGGYAIYPNKKKAMKQVKLRNNKVAMR